MCLASRIYECGRGLSASYKAKSFEMSESFFHQASRCLSTCDASDPASLSVEFVALFALTVYFQKSKSVSQLWLLSGDAVRLAMRLGYHREPSKFPQITPFEGEMRRRVWLFVSQADLVFSFHLGLPAVVRSVEFDTLLPRNLHEEELQPTMKELPLSHPLSEPTRISYLVAKDLILKVFRQIVEELNTLRPLSFDRVLALNDQLVKSVATLPKHLQRTTVDHNASSSTEFILQSIQLQLFYNKVMCVLHRRYMAEGLKNREFACSTKACVKSSLALLECQKSLHNIDYPTYGRWYTFPMTNHDFILAATMLCLYLSKSSSFGSGPQYTQGSSRNISGPGASQSEIREALKSSHSIWTAVRNNSKDTQRAFEIIEYMVSSIPCKNFRWQLIYNLNRWLEE